MDSNSKGMSRAAKRRRKESGKSAEKTKSESVPCQSDPNQKSVFREWADDDDTSQSENVLTDLNILSILDKVDVIDIVADDRAQALVSVLLAPMTRGEFYKQFWQNQPVHIENSKKAKALKDICSGKVIDDIINSHILQHSEDILLGKYYDAYQSYFVKDTSREDDTPEVIEINGSEVWRACANGYAFQLLSLQKHSDDVWRLLSALEHEFNAPLKCQVTVTTGHFAGFGPSLADGDEFIFQTEGCEKYRIHGSSYGVTSSGPGSSEWPPAVDGHKVVMDTSLISSAPYLEVEMSAGDVIYVPRGWVVEVLRPAAMADQRTAHITISTNHKNNILSLTETIFPQTLLMLEQHGSGVPQPAQGTSSSSGSSNGSSKNNRLASAASLAFRALPRQFISFMGVAHSEEENDTRRQEVRACFKRVLDVMQENALDLLDAVADQHAKDFIIARLPVPLTEREDQLTSVSSAESRGEVVHPYTKLRMVRPGVARAVVEDGMVVVYHCMDNSREMFGAPNHPLEFELDDGPAIEMLLEAYPRAVAVMDLPHPSEELDDKVSVAQALFKEGFLLVDDNSSSDNHQGVVGNSEDDDDSPF